MNLTSKFIVGITFLITGCIESYPPPVTSNDLSYLVVDGFVNSTEGIASVRLTYAVSLANETAFPIEEHATIILEDNDGSSLLIPYIGNGNYSASGLLIDNNKQYRLIIQTTSGKLYESDFVASKPTPPIDSVTWKPSSTGINILVNTHDDTQNSRYYQWTYEESWKYSSAFASSLLYTEGIVRYRTIDEDVHYCWHEESSTQLLVASSYRLNNDIISNFPIMFIPAGSEKVSIQYSILVKQNTLSVEAYDFLKRLEQTTENIGGLFDPQPGSVLGNIHAIDNPEEPVLGFFNVGAVESKRIFIHASELPDDIHYYNRPGICLSDTLYLVDFPAADKGNKIFLGEVYQGISVVGYTYTVPFCADCRMAGGKNIKPNYWE